MQESENNIGNESYAVPLHDEVSNENQKILSRLLERMRDQKTEYMCDFKKVGR